jgi:hypothetical protein
VLYGTESLPETAFDETLINDAENEIENEENNEI